MLCKIRLSRFKLHVQLCSRFGTTRVMRSASSSRSYAQRYRALSLTALPIVLSALLGTLFLGS